MIDDGSNRRLAADLAYYPPLPQAARLDWWDSACMPRIGWEWALLGLVQDQAADAHGLRRCPRLLVTMGGSDPHGADAQGGLGAGRARSGVPRALRDRAGRGRQDAAWRKTIVGLAPNFETLEGADDLATEYAAADVALCAFGVTAYELAAYGVPALYLCLTEDHALSASAFEHAGMGLSLGLAERAAGWRHRRARCGRC